mmetsp:Transcript_1910/g.3940  ORF Transcript_1910/g.3940 Transcript_1910/m.3940 type:complete len:254 (+) Transcript_1910:892-1653(+)
MALWVCTSSTSLTCGSMAGRTTCEPPSLPALASAKAACHAGSFTVANIWQKMVMRCSCTDSSVLFGTGSWLPSDFSTKRWQIFSSSRDRKRFTAAKLAGSALKRLAMIHAVSRGAEYASSRPSRCMYSHAKRNECAYCFAMRSPVGVKRGVCSTRAHAFALWSRMSLMRSRSAWRAGFSEETANLISMSFLVAAVANCTSWTAVSTACFCFVARSSTIIISSGLRFASGISTREEARSRELMCMRASLPLSRR